MPQSKKDYKLCRILFPCRKNIPIEVFGAFGLKCSLALLFPRIMNKFASISCEEYKQLPAVQLRKI